jgi:hypothetical protein
MRNCASFLLLLMITLQAAFARGWHGGSSQMASWWQVILTAVCLIVAVAVWRNHAGKILLAVAAAVFARELYVNWG